MLPPDAGFFMGPSYTRDLCKAAVWKIIEEKAGRGIWRSALSATGTQPAIRYWGS
jgi:hypothetical protein